jgi:hypothetical protein
LRGYSWESLRELVRVLQDDLKSLKEDLKSEAKNREALIERCQHQTLELKALQERLEAQAAEAREAVSIGALRAKLAKALHPDHAQAGSLERAVREHAFKAVWEIIQEHCP